jgi:hypothetical protein
MIDATICLLSTHKTIPWGDDPVPHVIPAREIHAFPNVHYSLIYDKRVDAALMMVIRNLESTKWPLTVFVESQML